MNLSRNSILFTILMGVLLTLNVVVTHNVLTEPFPGHYDFLSRWEGTRSFWIDGLNPYSDEASYNIQQRYFGRTPTGREDLVLFAYPFYTVFFLLPFIFTSFAWAAAVWMVLLESCLLVSLILLLHHFRWRPSPLLLGVLLFWNLVSYFPARNLILGQLAALVYFCEVFTIWALARKNDRWAGILLAISTVKPQMGFLVIPFLLLWAWREKRWIFLTSFLASFGVLMAASFALVPNWMFDWLNQVSAYPTYTHTGSSIWIISNWPWLHIDPETGLWEVAGGFGRWLDLGLSGLMYLYLGRLWYQAVWLRRPERFMWTLVMTLAITHFVAPRTASTHFILFMVPLIFYVRNLTGRFKGRRGTLFAISVLAFLFIQQWVHFLLTVVSQVEHPTVSLLTPFLVFVLLLTTQQWWWRDATDRFQSAAKLSP